VASTDDFTLHLLPCQVVNTGRVRQFPPYAVWTCAECCMIAWWHDDWWVINCWHGNRWHGNHQWRTKSSITCDCRTGLTKMWCDENNGKPELRLRKKVTSRIYGRIHCSWIRRQNPVNIPLFSIGYFIVLVPTRIYVLSLCRSLGLKNAHKMAKFM